MALHQTGKMMVVCMPGASVKRDHLSQKEPVKDRFGNGTNRSIGKREVIARSIDTPPDTAQALAEHFRVRHRPSRRLVSGGRPRLRVPRDPYHRVDVHRSSRRVSVSANGTTIAESTAPALPFETSIPDRFYLPPDAVRTDLLVRSETVSECSYKGDGQHWHVKVGDTLIEGACWSLTAPLGDALFIPRWFSFYTEKLDVEVDDQKQ